ncbi:hypothetical protein C8R46DRAFT_1316074, partial [Mycena filopes]
DLSQDDPPFDPAFYIGQGKKYPKKDTLLVVHDALDTVLEIPPTHTALIPKPDLPISDFLRFPLPKNTSALVFSKPGTWFSRDAPTTSAECLFTRPIPPVEFLGDLRKAVGQAWFDGCQSITDPRFNGGRDRFPLWVLSVWQELERVVKDQNMWRRSRDWIDLALEKPNLDDADLDGLTSARSLLDTLGWDTKINGGWTTFNLALILSNAWLSDDHIDMMMADLSARVASDPKLADTLLIAPLAFANAIASGATKKSYTREQTPLLARYEDHIKTKRLTELLFPVHINDNHWIAGHVDFEKGLIGTGDSRASVGSPPVTFVKNLKRWLKTQFGRDFVYLGDSLEHGDQKDSSSCSIITRNTIAAKAFGEATWAQRNAAGARAVCFIRLVRSAAIREMVSQIHIPSRQHLIHFQLPVVPKNTPVLTAETPAEISVAVAIGDHNFPDLAGFALRQTRPTLADLMNPAPDANATMSDVAPSGSLFAFLGINKPKTNPEATEAKLGKRSRKPDSDLDETTDVDPAAPAKKPKKANGTGTSKSATSVKKTRDALKSGALTVATADPTRYTTWQDTLRQGKKGKKEYADPDVKFHDTDVKKARHSLCGQWITMGEVYECGRWNSHIKTGCPKLNPGKKRPRKGDGLDGVPTLIALGFRKGTSDPEAKPAPQIPCPGLTEGICPRLPIYLARTGAFGGGSRSVTVIARELFRKMFKRLKSEDKDRVTDQQRHERQWTNDHTKQRVFSTNCKKLVAPRASRTLPCSECSSILNNPRFKRAIRLEIPDDENYIYVNEQYRNQQLGHLLGRVLGLKEIMTATDAKNTPCIKFAQGTLQGKYSDDKVFAGLVEAMVQKHDRIERGVGMQNFKYPPAWEEMAHIVNIHSPRAAKALRQHIPLPTQRNFRQKEAREPRFPMVIDEERTFKLIQDQLAALKYDGPLGLSCDDTKLFPGLRLYNDKIKNADFLVGGVDGPIRVADPEAMKRILADPTIVRGTKVRLWCLTIPLPGITPLVVAAIPIRDNMTADELLGPLETILYGLLERNLRVISYACDGTETERLLQRKLVEKAEKVIRHKIPNPTAGAPELEIVIAFFRGYPVVMIQDAKHALKTFRNNLFTGAKYFAMGNFTAIFRRILQIAMAPGGPLYRRDAVRLDRQDDAAACRLFCADVLQYLSEHHPDHIGEIIYLFIFGELVDAYQSREISHAERIKLALRARYFLDAWSKYLDVAGYKKQQYFLSREAVDIARILIEGIISLIIVHRDHVPGLIPLLPWYHSSEPCEHTFGNSRDIVKDFTFLDFIFMAAKLRITMREAVLSGKTSGGKAPAQGYTHTYFDTIGADLAKLAVYPSDAEIAQASAEAAAECDSLIALLGITPGQLYEGVPAQLPGIRSWFPDDEDDVIDDVVEPAEEFDDIEDQMGDAEELQALIDAEERLDAPLRSAKTDRELMSLTCASIALSLDEHMRIQEFQRVDEDLEEEILGDEYMTIKETLASIPVTLPPLQLLPEASTPFASTAFDTLDFKALVRQRRQHQTRQAAKSARVKIHHGDDDDSAPTAPVESPRRQILRKYHELLKEDQSKATGTAVERQARWTTDPKPAGNAANAAAAATAVATRV